MRINKIKFLVTFILGLMLSIAACFTAFADWSGDCNWEYNYDGGSVICKWEKCEGAKYYYLTVYKGQNSYETWYEKNQNCSEKNCGAEMFHSNSKTAMECSNCNNIVYPTDTTFGPEKVGGITKNVTNYIIKKGSGTYYFHVEAFGNEDGESTFLGALDSYDLVIDSNDLSKTKKTRDTNNQTEAASDGWHEYPDNTWTYGKGNNTLAKNEWMDINGKRYHFDSKGYMNKGWTQVNGAYYYFDPKNGDLWTNTTTPDGYTVNSEGVRIDKTGNTVTGGAVNATVTVSLSEAGENGTIKKATVTGVSNANLVDWSFDTPYEQWSVGLPVKLYVRINPNNGFPFNKNSKFSCNNATFLEATGENPTTLTFSYYPKMKLTAPTNLTIDSYNVVKWAAVPNAQYYTVKVYGDEPSPVKTETISSTQYDITEYLDDNTSVDVGVIALRNKSSKSNSISRYYSNSDEVKLSGVKDMIESNLTSEGGFRRSDEHLYYIDGSDNRLKGWNQIQGSWYYFGNNGYAVGPGWWQDSDSNWYYFDDQHRMMTGTITDNGKQYFMNDGSNPNYPLGAWVQ